MDEFTQFYNSLPPQVWAFLFGAPAIVLAVNISKKVFGVNSTLVIHTLTATTSFLVTALPLWVLNDPKPFDWLGAYSAAFFTAANFLYAVSKKLAPFFQDVQNYEARKAAAAASTLDPATPASVSSTSGTVSYTTTSGTNITPTVTKIPVTDPTVFQG